MDIREYPWISFAVGAIPTYVPLSTSTKIQTLPKYSVKQLGNKSCQNCDKVVTLQSGRTPRSLSLQFVPKSSSQRIWRLPWFGRVRVYLFSLWSVVVIFLALICWPCRGYEEHHMSSTMKTGMQVRIVNRKSSWCLSLAIIGVRVKMKGYFCIPSSRLWVSSLSSCLVVVHGPSVFIVSESRTLKLHQNTTQIITQCFFRVSRHW